MAETPNQVPQPGDQIRPGETIVPTGSPRPADARVTMLEKPVQPLSDQGASVVAEVPPTAQPPVTPPQAESSPGPLPTHNQLLASDDGSVSWTASEFIAHAKSSSWYAGLALAAVLSTGLIYLITRDLITCAVVIVCAFVLGMYAGHQPRQLQYVINDQGIGVGAKFYPFEAFKSFTVLAEGAFSEIVFMPLKRFGTAVTVYYDPKDEDQIANILSERLPYEDARPDPVERLMRRIRF